MGISGLIVGVLAGTGLACCWWSWWPRARPTPQLRPRWWRHLGDMVAASGAVRLTAGRFVAIVAATVVVAGVVGSVVTRSPAVGCCLGALAGVVPVQVLAARGERRRARLESAWPDVVDQIASAVRAGVGLPEAIGAVAQRGPQEVREAFAAFSADYRAGGHYAQALAQLGERLADPVADRIVATLQLARDVGGGELGALLRALSGFLREDLRVRGEARARQSWTVAGARLAAAAPWVVLVLLSTRTDAMRAFNTGAGVGVLAAGAAATVVAYVVMVRLGRLSTERRLRA